MSWAEIKKAINSDLSTPLNSQLTSKTNELASKFGWTLESDSSYDTGSTTRFTKYFNGIGYWIPLTGSGSLQVTIGYSPASWNDGRTFFPVVAGQEYSARGVRVIIYKLGGGV